MMLCIYATLHTFGHNEPELSANSNLHMHKHITNSKQENRTKFYSWIRQVLKAMDTSYPFAWSPLICLHLLQALKTVNELVIYIQTEVHG